MPSKIRMEKEAGVQNHLNLLDSRSPLSWGQVYPCESRGGNDKIGEITFLRTHHRLFLFFFTKGFKNLFRCHGKGVKSHSDGIVNGVDDSWGRG